MKLHNLIKCSIFIIVFCFLPSFTNAKEEFKPILFEAKVGESFVLNIHNEKMRYNGDNKIKEIKGITKVDVITESKSSEYYNVVWKYNKTDIYSIYPQNDPVTPLLEDLNRGLIVSLKIDNIGTIVEINNKEEIKSYMKEAIDKIMNSLSSKGAPPDFINNIKTQFYTIFTNENSFQQTILKDASLFYSGYGLDFTESDTIQYESNLPNPLSGTPISAKGEYHLSGAPDSYIINWQQVVDPEEAKLFIQDFMNKLNQNIPSGQLPAFDITDKATFKFKGTNIILLNHERKVEMLGKKRIDRIKIELKKPLKAQQKN